MTGVGGWVIGRVDWYYYAFPIISAYFADASNKEIPAFAGMTGNPLKRE